MTKAFRLGLEHGYAAQRPDETHAPTKPALRWRWKIAYRDGYDAGVLCRAERNR